MASMNPIVRKPIAWFNTFQGRQKLFIWGSLTGIIAYFIVFSFYPILMSLYISLHKWPFLEPVKPFIGLDNYIKVLNDQRFWISLKNTTYYAVAYVVFCVIIGLMMALLINTTHPVIQKILRPIYFAPQITSAVAIALMFAWLYQPQWGVLNYLLKLMGIPSVMWLTSSKVVMNSVIITGVWRSVGYSMVIFTAGLLGVPRDLREAAMIDGAGSWQSFWRIVIPLLQPTVLFMAVTSMIGGFQVFTEVWLMTGGGPGTASRVLVLEIYDQGFRYFEMGYASAIAFYLFLIIAVISFFEIRYMRESFEF